MSPALTAAAEGIAVGDLNRFAAAHALNRLGYGPRPGDVEAVMARGVERYIQEQLEPGPDPELDSRMASFPYLGWTVGETWNYYQIDQQTANDANASNNTNYIGTLHNQLREGQIVRSVHSRNQLLELMTWFWFNHFNVNLPDDYVRYSAHHYERELRRHALGKFKDLLSVSAHHPAMMSYLDNYLSTISKYDRNGRLTSGLNENYGRELLELHTVGVDAGYTQEDVYNAAVVLTGWGFNQRQGTFQFTAANHDPRATSVFGLSIPQGEMQSSGERLLDYLAKHEATAHFISRKLVRYLVADDPPESLVRRAAATFQDSDGDIREVLETIIGSREFWAAGFGLQYKNPFQFVVGTLRALDAEVSAPRTLPAVLSQMGQPQYNCIPPTGWSERGREWVNPSSHLYRMNFALDLVSAANTTPFPGVTVDVQRLVRSRGIDPTNGRAVATMMNAVVFGNRLSAGTLNAAASLPSAGLVPIANRTVGLVLAGPEAQGR